MNPMTRLIALRVVAADSAAEFVRHFHFGTPVPTFSVGTQGNWGIMAGGVEPVHFFLTFTGTDVFAARGSASSVVFVDGAELGLGWQAVPIGSTLYFGGARVSVGYESPASKTEVLPPARFEPAGPVPGAWVQTAALEPAAPKPQASAGPLVPLQPARTVIVDRPAALEPLGNVVVKPAADPAPSPGHGTVALGAQPAPPPGLSAHGTVALGAQPAAPPGLSGHGTVALGAQPAPRPGLSVHGTVALGAQPAPPPAFSPQGAVPVQAQAIPGVAPAPAAFDPHRQAASPPEAIPQPFAQQANRDLAAPAPPNPAAASTSDFESVKPPLSRPTGVEEEQKNDFSTVSDLGALREHAGRVATATPSAAFDSAQAYEAALRVAAPPAAGAMPIAAYNPSPFPGPAPREAAEELARIAGSSPAPAPGPEPVDAPAKQPSGLAKSWKDASIAKKLTIALLPLGLAGVILMPTDEPPPPEPVSTGATKAQQPSGNTIAAALPSARLADSGSQARSLPTLTTPSPVQSAPTIPRGGPSASTRQTVRASRPAPSASARGPVPEVAADSTPRDAIAAAFEGRTQAAVKLYEQLANTTGDPTFALAARLVRENSVRKPAMSH